MWLKCEFCGEEFEGEFEQQPCPNPDCGCILTYQIEKDEEE